MRWYWGPLRRQLVLFAALVGVLAIIGAAALPVFIVPPQKPPHRSDVILVIGPPDPWRVAWAEQLIAAGDDASNTLMISVPDDAAVPQCGNTEPYAVLCHRPSPFTTRGEARWLRSEMSAHGWTTATVITMTPHVLRAQVRMDRCVPHGVSVIGRDPGLDLASWLYQLGYQTAGWIKVGLQWGC